PRPDSSGRPRLRAYNAGRPSNRAATVRERTQVARTVGGSTLERSLGPLERSLGPLPYGRASVLEMLKRAPPPSIARFSRTMESVRLIPLGQTPVQLNCVWQRQTPPRSSLSTRRRSCLA